MLPPDQGGVGRITIGSSGIVFITQVGMWFGYVSFGFITDAIGRKRAFVTFLLVASALLPIYGFTKNPYALLGLGPFVAFFGTGYFSGFGVLTAEIYPKSIPRHRPGGQPTISAESPARRRLSSSGRWRPRADSASRSPSPARRSCWPPLLGSGFLRRAAPS